MDEELKKQLEFINANLNVIALNQVTLYLTLQDIQRQPPRRRRMRRRYGAIK